MKITISRKVLEKNIIEYWKISLCDKLKFVMETLSKKTYNSGLDTRTNKGDKEIFWNKHILERSSEV